ncbi:MAG: YitT family protein [Eubacteriales bacterium]
MENTKFAKDTSERSKLEWAQGLLVLFIGLCIAHLGVTLFVLANLGTDTFTVLIQGIANTFGLTIGTWHVIACITIMVLLLMTTEGYVKPGTVVCAFCGGWIIDFFSWALSPFINDQTSIIVRVVVLVLGVVILGVGMSVVIKSNSGTGPNDLVAIVLSDKVGSKFKLQFRTVRIICDIVFVVLGFILGGVVGIGTIIAVVITGPIVQFFLPKSEAVIHKIFPSI